METVNQIYPIYTYTNQTHLKFVNSLIKLAYYIAFSRFIEKNVMYACVIPLKTNHRDIIIKFGCTTDIFSISKSLISEYGSEIYFIDMKLIKSKSHEIKFHKLIRGKYPELIESININGKNKTKLYKLSPVLLKEFDSYKPNDKVIDLIDAKISNLIEIEYDQTNIV